ncbi:hypothetical protein JAAARDRAFT_47909 [Jaapia argillacea MUCL 33604]|uniref:F-box domain-containing protein n=1 Tax=Jaapia argillacea MUCL 33604 TaxID=933084 RepID=A0A067Q435_9AGAM|nr:hypothetical protein JAAARDRAFT_47909 [Jaapia argillacea MUCL 33604]
MESNPNHPPCIDRIPAELLSSIFEFGAGNVIPSCHPIAGRRLLENLDFSSRSAVCLVSRRFREVAVHTSTLWTSIVIPVGHHRSKKCQVPSLDYLRPFLQSYCEDAGEAYVEQIFEHIGPHMVRLTAMSFEIEDQVSAVVIFDHLRNVSVPALEHLQIEDPSRAFRPKHRIFAGGAPRLVSLTVTVSYDIIGKRGPRLPLGAITEFTIRGYSLYIHPLAFSGMMAAMPSIHTLTLDDIGLRDSPLLPTKVPLLTTLSLRGDVGTLFFRDLHAPMLHSLSLFHPGDELPDILRAISTMANFPSLESFALHEPRYNAPTTILSDFIRSTPVLTDLHLTLDSAGTNSILEVLQTGEDHRHDQDVSPSWPRLKTMILGSVASADLRRFLLFRVDCGHPIQNLILDMKSYRLPKDGDGMEMVAWLDVVSSEGSLVCDSLEIIFSTRVRYNPCGHYQWVISPTVRDPLKRYGYKDNIAYRPAGVFIRYHVGMAPECTLLPLAIGAVLGSLPNPSRLEVRWWSLE